MLRHDTFWYRVLPVVNLVLVVICIWGNSVSNAGFCRPVLWAAVVQGVSFLNVITFTWMERSRLYGLNALICGVSTGVYVYWCLFLGAWVIVMPVPVWFLLLLLWCNVVHPVHGSVRWWYVTGIGARWQSDDGTYCGNAFPVSHQFLHLRWLAPATARPRLGVGHEVERRERPPWRFAVGRAVRIVPQHVSRPSGKSVLCL